MSTAALLTNDAATWKNIYVTTISTTGAITMGGQLNGRTPLGVPSSAATANKFVLSARVTNAGAITTLSGGITAVKNGTGDYTFTLTGLTDTDSCTANVVGAAAGMANVVRVDGTHWQVLCFDPAGVALDAGCSVHISCY